MIMANNLLTDGCVRLAVFSVTMPILLYMAADLPQRTLLKESLSLLVIVSFSFMIAQFFLSRSGRKLFPDMKMGRVMQLHKILGYIFIPVLLVHPILIVVPRFFEAGVDPMDAFFTMLTTFESVGIVLGLCSWLLMLIIGLTSYFRSQLFKSYTNWRSVHGVLSVLFIISGLWHALELGRHMHGLLSLFIVACSTVGLLLFSKTFAGHKANKVQEAAA